MNLWATFWLVCLVVAGGAFALITLVVAVRGVKDLRTFLTELGREKAEIEQQDDYGR